MRRNPDAGTPSTARTDVVVLLGAVALLAVHATVDGALAPEPGTGPGDHVSRLAASLLALAAIAAVATRVPAGGRAASAAFLAVLALEGATLAVLDARSVGPRGEDWTGFLLLPVGVALCVVAGRALWSSRKPGKRRHLRRAGLALIALLTAYWVVVPVAVGILATHRPRQPVAAVGLGRPHRDLTIRTRDGLDLAAWYVPSRNGAAVILYPSRSATLEHARMLVRHGYGTLLVDARGYDGSQGDANLFGWEGATDVDAAVAWLETQPDVHGGIGGLGLSVGGEVLLQAAASDTRLRAVVSEGAGVRSVREHLLRGPQGWFSLPMAAVQTAVVGALGGSLPPPSLADLVARIGPRHLLLVYAGKGGGGEELNPEYFDAARPPIELWKIPEARHVGGLQSRPREYERRVTALFDRALLDQR